MWLCGRQLHLLSVLSDVNTPSIGQEDLKFLHSELHPVTDKSFALGVQLQIPVESLKCIEAEHNQMNRHLLEMLTVWLKGTNPHPTWNILTETLESPPIEEKLLAQQLRDKYCSRTEGIVTLSYLTQESDDTTSQGINLIVLAVTVMVVYDYKMCFHSLSM